MAIMDLLLKFSNLSPGEPLPQLVALEGISPRQFNASGELDDPYLYEDERAQRYSEYDAMDMSYGDISVALDVYAEESTQKNDEIDKTVWVTSDDKEIQNILETFLERIDIEDKVFGMARHLGKYGDLFVFPTVGTDDNGKISGIDDLIFFHPSAVEAAVDPRTGKLVGYNCDIIQFESAASPSNPDNTIQKAFPDNIEAKKEEGFSPWDFVHFKLSGINLVSEYGSSMIEAARKTWQTLAMLETAIALHRLLRSGVKYIYYTDVGKATTPDQALLIMQRYIQAVKKEQVLQIKDPSINRDSSVGSLQQFLSRFKAYGMYDDIFWPVKEGSQSKIDTIQVSGDIFAIEDVRHYQNKLRTSLGIPKAYLEQDINGWQANKGLAQQDVRFAKKTERLQKGMVNGLTELCALHLLYSGFTEFSFTIHMEPPSALLTLQRLEVLGEKQNIATSMMGLAETFGFNKETWSVYVLREILGMPEAKIQYFKLGAAAPPMPIQTAPGFSRSSTVGGELINPDQSFSDTMGSETVGGSI